MYDVIVIGAGPAGLTAATNTSLRGLTSLVIEKQDTPGGLPTLLYPDKIIRDHPGFPVGILGKEFSRMLTLQAKNAGVEIRTDEEALRIDRKEDNLLEVTTVQGVYQGRRIILCTGIYNLPKKLEILKDYVGPNVHYKVDDPKAFKNKHLIIVGGGDHAFDTAVQMSDQAKSVTILERHEYAKAKASTVQLAESRGVTIRYNTELSKVFKTQTGRFRNVQITNRTTDAVKTVDADELFIAIGFEPVKTFLQRNDFQLRSTGSVRVDKDLQTNVKGVFAAGDITGEPRLIATACAEGIIAAISTHEAIQQPYWIR
jgi:thioredoxin reductase (NADPH)